jgi:hypothetical protein
MTVIVLITLYREDLGAFYDGALLVIGIYVMWVTLWYLAWFRSSSNVIMMAQWAMFTFAAVCDSIGRLVNSHFTPALLLVVVGLPISFLMWPLVELRKHSVDQQIEQTRML